MNDKLAKLIKAQLHLSQVYRLVQMGCLQFLVLTTVAMFFYKGGTYSDPGAHGYSFFENFFSDLGRTVSRLGEPNTVSAVLFFLALSLAGVGQILFFLIFPRFFSRALWTRILSWTGSAVGVASGICFVGIACAPANLLADAHIMFVLAAFRLFTAAIIIYTLLLLLDNTYRQSFLPVFVVFSVLLVAYLLLLTSGLSMRSNNGLVTQVIGQKIIAYASIGSIWFQAWNARRLLKNHPNSLESLEGSSRNSA